MRIHEILRFGFIKRKQLSFRFLSRFFCFPVLDVYEMNRTKIKKPLSEWQASISIIQNSKNLDPQAVFVLPCGFID
ncbi:hypothetical protein HOLDEFILI_00921 [Holdemania filiformis DSM 12042]|uniref:Uncharacterized protein n=1 Tax=Holdemania filiformis DSM 12042 TaxID=545696 RepID=B9Y540_9FIRM|nr:hypothetical protein HOLDEFILI_00921 [Holdemania filiformis DSM 12042]